MIEHILDPLVQNHLRDRRPTGDQEHEIQRAGLGAAMLATSGWWLVFLARNPVLRTQLADLAERSAPSAVPIAEGAGALFVLIGALLFFVGAARSRGNRDILVAAKALAWIAIVGAMLWFHVSLARWPWADFALSTAYVWTFTSAVTRLLLALRGMRVEHLPDPSAIPDLPMSGPASVEEAQAGMSGVGDWVPPTFRR